MTLTITWYGLSCFRLRDRHLSIVADPYGPEVGLTLPRLTADIVTISHHAPGHDYAKAVRGKPLQFDGPGEYEVHNVFITAIRTWRNTEKKDSPNTIFHFNFDSGVSVLHLGDIGHAPNQATLETIGEVDVLLLPVGNGSALDVSGAIEMITLLEPRLVIPMHYELPGLKIQLDSVDRFLNELGAGEVIATDELKIAKSSLPKEMSVVKLNAKITA